jgi:tetratricopeptide (TPR) repeat protein
MDLAIASGDEALLLEAHHRQWPTKLHMGDYSAADYHLDHGLATYDPDRHHSLTYIYTGHDPGVCCRNHSAKILWHRGYPDRAVERCLEAVALAERVSHPLSRALALQTLSYVHLLRREPADARRCLDKWIPLTKEFGLQLSASDARFQLGWALAEEGRAEEGIPEMHDALAAITATGAEVGLQEYVCVIAQACGDRGETREGLDLLERGFAIAEAGAKYRLPELLRVKAELLLRINPRDDTAESWFRRAVRTAREEGTKSLELRAVVSLAQLYRDHGRVREARGLLGPLYAWFTEGLGTRDLLDAKDLLDRLE